MYLRKGASMGSEREAFLLALGARRSVLSPHVRGTLRIDLVTEDRVERWFVTMAGGDVAVSRESRPADGVFTTSPELFDRLVRGETPATAALLRNEATFAGPNPRLILSFQRLFPSPPGSGDPRSAARRQAPYGAAWRQRLQATLDRKSSRPS
jgi:hypothetical protein